MSVDIKIANDSESKEWDKLVDSSPHGTIFHTWKWLKIMEKHSGSKLYPVIGLKGTTPVGVFPIFYQKVFLVKTVFSPPPQLAIPYLGPAIVDYDELKQDKKESIFIEFQKQVDDFIFSELKANYISISSSPGLLDVRPFKWTGYQVQFLHNYILNLSRGADYVWRQFSKQLRIDTKKTESAGVYVEDGFREELEIIYDALFGRYREQDRVLSITKKFLFDVYDSFYPQNLHIFAAKQRGKVVGGFVAPYYKDKILVWIGLPKTNLHGIYPNDLSQWKAIKWACEHGLMYYELIGANTHRLRHYKSKYNPNLSTHYSLKKYSSFLTKMAETAYPRMLKPMYTKIKLKTK